MILYREKASKVFVTACGIRPKTSMNEVIAIHIIFTLPLKFHINIGRRSQSLNKIDRNMFAQFLWSKNFEIWIDFASFASIRK